MRDLSIIESRWNFLPIRLTCSLVVTVSSTPSSVGETLSEAAMCDSAGLLVEGQRTRTSILALVIVVTSRARATPATFDLWVVMVCAISNESYLVFRSWRSIEDNALYIQPLALFSQRQLLSEWVSMGVPAFFRWLSRKYPSIVVPCQEDKAQTIDGYQVSQCAPTES